MSSKALRFDFHSCGLYIELGIMPLFRVPRCAEESWRTQVEHGFPRSWGRNNESEERNGSRLSSALNRAARVFAGASFSRTRSFITRSASTYRKCAAAHLRYLHLSQRHLQSINPHRSSDRAFAAETLEPLETGKHTATREISVAGVFSEEYRMALCSRFLRNIFQ